jgi:hypothetical protein
MREIAGKLNALCPLVCSVSAAIVFACATDATAADQTEYYVGGGLLLSGNLAFAQQTNTPPADPELERYKAQTARITAETERKKAEQEAAKQEKQSEIDRLKAEKDLLDVQNSSAQSTRKDEIDKIKAQKDLIDAASLKLSGAPEGTVTFDDKGASAIENTIMAYEAFAAIAKPIADAIVQNRPDGTFIIIGNGDRSALMALPVFESQADLLAKRLADVHNLQTNSALKFPEPGSEPSSALAGLATVGAFLNAATSLVALFRVDDTFVIKDETPDMRAIYSVIAKLVTENKGKVYYPDAMAPNLFDDVSTSEVHKKLARVLAELDKLWATHFQRIADNDRATKALAAEEAKIEKSEKAEKDIAALTAERARPATTAARKKEIDTLIAAKQKDILDESVLIEAQKTVASLRAYLEANKAYIALLDRVLKSGDEYITAMTKADAGTTAPFAALVAADRLRSLYKKALPKTYAIEIGVVRLSGTRREHRNFFGTSVAFSGGVVASYRVFSPSTGELLASDTVHHIKPLKKLEQ